MMPLVFVSLLLFALRLFAATRVGFGDSEALYAAWAIHPQPAYLDHPGLVGLAARAIGDGTVPVPVRTHVITSVVATLVPWLVVLAARVFGARPKHAMVAGLVVALVPETAIGLFALTPDLLLAPLWLAAIIVAGLGLAGPAGETRSAIAFIAAGLLAGIASAAKISGLLLLLALAITYASVARSRMKESAAARTIWPWAGLATGLVVLVPIVSYEMHLGFPMLRHRLVDTQHGAGLALRNASALVLGQLLYLSPVVACVAFRCARDLIRRRDEDAQAKLLFFTFAVPIVPLVALTLWSRVAEPHWIAPALLALPIHAARPDPTARVTEASEPRRVRDRFSRASIVAAIAVAGLFTVAAHAWVLMPSSSALLPADADLKLDIASELYGWPSVLEAAREQMKDAATPYDPAGQEVVVVGPHWTICAQLAAGLPDVRVGCATPIPDDFDRWVPRSEWRSADHVLFVTDNRFEGDGADQLPEHVRGAQARVHVMRGSKIARVFELVLYDHRASGTRGGHPIGREAARQAEQ